MCKINFYFWSFESVVLSSSSSASISVTSSSLSEPPSDFHHHHFLGHLLHLHRQLHHLLRFITFWLKLYRDYYTWKCKNKCCQCCYGNRLTHFISDCYHYPLFWLFLVLLFRDLYILFYFISLSVGLSLPFINLLIFYGNLVSNMQINR